MVEPLELISLSHINAIVDGHDSSIDHFTDLWGGVVNFRIPDDGEVRACLITIGGVIYELFAPNDRTAERGQGRLLGRFGDHYIGAEYRVPDVQVARERCEGLGIRILNDRRDFFFTYPGSTHGIAWELWDQDWHDVLAASNPDLGPRTPVPPRSYWLGQPLGLTGLVRFSTVVEDLEVAVARFGEAVGAKETYRVARPAAGAVAVGMAVGDTVMEVMAPTGAGPVRDYLERYGERIRSSVYGVTDMGRAEAYFSAKGITLVAGDAPGTKAIPPAQNHGLLFELSEEPATHP